MVYFILIGGGGAGGGAPQLSTKDGSANAGGAGGSGAIIIGNFKRDISSSFTYTVGAGGTGVAGSSGNNGDNSTIKYQSVTITAGGGKGGGAGVNIHIYNNSLSRISGTGGTGGICEIPLTIGTFGISHIINGKTGSPGIVNYISATTAAINYSILGTSYQSGTTLTVVSVEPGITFSLGMTYLIGGNNDASINGLNTGTGGIGTYTSSKSLTIGSSETPVSIYSNSPGLYSGGYELPSINYFNVALTGVPIVSSIGTQQSQAIRGNSQNVNISGTNANTISTGGSGAQAVQTSANAAASPTAGGNGAAGGLYVIELG